ncbi:sensor histidine kinase [Microtetraspora sp. AC03309]|uniref:sensor histidine kinase n=1 Tax=Microtetraspora sp. AC03309 TaxID=2779376 RepID=UPI001E3DB7E1|nr:histidine kinase [Microtetraspora sp. AC03309]MCC5574086.1 sensor histidine kinase [Microtetraspora sp. AC03309]
MVADGLGRARKIVRWTLNVTLVAVWFVVGVAVLAGFATDTTGWHRVLPAVVGLAVFSWLFFRITGAVLDHRYARREIVASGPLSLFVMVVGGSQMLGWGFVPLAWLSIAAVGLSKKAAVALGAGTAVVVIPLAVISTLAGGDPTFPTDEASVAGVIAGVAFYYVVMCALFPWTNRLWVWIWRLAEEAHAGREAQARLAVAEERLRFARDLHDLVGHQLSAIAVKSELAVRLSAAEDAAAARDEMAEVRGLARTALRELRETVRGYRTLDLGAELAAIRGVLEAAGVSCHLHLPYRGVPDDVAAVFAWVVREAATNILRHSSASRCDITVRHSEEEAVLEVRNDGVARRAVEDVGSGLAGLGERLAAVGGTLNARPTGSGEFVLRAVAPVPAKVGA